MEQQHPEGSNPSFPPGTVILEARDQATSSSSEIILHPHPTNDPNDPLVRNRHLYPILPLLTWLELVTTAERNQFWFNFLLCPVYLCNAGHFSYRF